MKTNFFEYFEGYTPEEITIAITSLDPAKQAILFSLYDKNGNLIDKKNADKGISDFKLSNSMTVLRQTLIMVRAQKKKEVKQVLFQKEKPKLSEVIETLEFNQIVNSLSLKEKIIIWLNLGYIDGVCYSTKKISQLFEIEEKNVETIIQKCFITYNQKSLKK